MNEYTHIIEKVNIEVDVTDLTTAHRIRDNMADFLHRDVFPNLEEMFNGVGDTGRSYSIDKLSLDLTFDSEREFEDKFPSVVLSGISTVLNRAVVASEKVVREQVIKEHAVNEQLVKEIVAEEQVQAQQFGQMSGNERQWEVFLYFLRTGTLPWFAATDGKWMDEDELLQLLTDSTINWRTSFYDTISSDTAAIRRLLLQFTPSFIARILGSYAKKDIVAILSHSRFTYTDGPENQLMQRVFLRSVLDILAKESTPGLTDASLQDILDRTIQVHGSVSNEEYADKEELVAELKENPVKENVLDAGGIYVHHVGLVLLHPFLQYFFKEFDLLDGKHFRDVAASQTAAHLLYYLATGNVQPMEFNMIMEKYLCGIYIHEPIERFTPLTDKMKDECRHLLQAAIGHWKSLKNTSPDGLREAFLRRNGRLFTEHGRDNLVVEHKSIDVLLDQLPWSFSIIALPWLEKEIYVDWNASIR